VKPENQLDLFTRARSSDPWTSKAAARTVTEFDASHFGIIANALTAIGKTAYEVAASAKLEYAQVHKRLPEMERMNPPLSALDRDDEGKVKTRKGPKGRECRLWRKP
jgi:hypothetical protein